MHGKGDDVRGAEDEVAGLGPRERVEGRFGEAVAGVAADGVFCWES